MKNRMKVLSVFFFMVVYAVLNPALYSLPENADEKIFQFENREIQVKTQSSPCGNISDIFLYDGKVEKNLSRDMNGENLYPEALVFGENFYISWVNYQGEDEYLCLYEANRDNSNVLNTGKIKYIGRDRKIIFPGTTSGTIFFKARAPDNIDIFCYGLLNGRIKNIGNTPANEKKFRVIPDEDSGNAVIESETLYHIYRYRFNPETQGVTLLEKREIYRENPAVPVDRSLEDYRKYITYGDSITWGKMRMNNLPYDPTKSYHHPELAYPLKVKEILDKKYGDGTVNYYNLSNPGETTAEGAARIYEIASYNAKFFLLFFGTNDAIYRDLDLNDSLENLAYMADTAAGYGMDVIISTIPPRNDGYWYEKEWVKPHIQELNQGIIDMAKTKNIRQIDTYTAFMNYEPPGGWKKLLEDRDSSDIYKPERGGQHPSPTGHQVIAELFVPKILSCPPQTPGNISISTIQGSRIYIQWQQNSDFDFSHYNIRFGYFPGELNLSISTSSPVFTFIRPPFPTLTQTCIYFRIQAVDDSGSGSPFTATFSETFAAKRSFSGEQRARSGEKEKK